MAREADPSAQLFINEQFGNYTGELVELFFDLIEWLLEEDVPIDGVGIQARNISEPQSKRVVIRAKDRRPRLASGSHGIRCPHSLVRRRARPIRARDYMAEYARICIESPACIGFTLWGLSDASTWFDWVPPFNRMLPNDPLLFDVNSRPKPAYAQIREALKNRP